MGEADLAADRLANRLRDLVEALDRQHLDGKPPGAYHYSPNVERALARARRVLGMPDAFTAPSPNDVGHLRPRPNHTSTPQPEGELTD